MDHKFFHQEYTGHRKRYHKFLREFTYFHLEDLKDFLEIGKELEVKGLEGEAVEIQENEAKEPNKYEVNENLPTEN